MSDGNTVVVNRITGSSISSSQFYIPELSSLEVCHWSFLQKGEKRDRRKRVLPLTERQIDRRNLHLSFVPSSLFKAVEELGLSARAPAPKLTLTRENTTLFGFDEIRFGWGGDDFFKQLFLDMHSRFIQVVTADGSSALGSPESAKWLNFALLLNWSEYILEYNSSIYPTGYDGEKKTREYFQTYLRAYYYLLKDGDGGIGPAYWLKTAWNELADQYGWEKA